MVTGKGQPDTRTRRLLNRLARETGLPMFALVDPDPHGKNPPPALLQLLLLLLLHRQSYDVSLPSHMQHAFALDSIATVGHVYTLY
jgi:hypothetical protein